jgi:hypothetical protein
MSTFSPTSSPSKLSETSHTTTATSIDKEIDGQKGQRAPTTRPKKAPTAPASSPETVIYPFSIGNTKVETPSQFIALQTIAKECEQRSVEEYEGVGKPDVRTVTPAGTRYKSYWVRDLLRQKKAYHQRLEEIINPKEPENSKAPDCDLWDG